MFILHPQLAADTLPLGDLSLCRVLLMNNSRFPWLILVPQREGLREIFDLDAPEYATAMNEVRQTAQTLSAFTQAHKINIAALGNQVPQLHIHIIARFTHDAAWPQPVWSASLPPAPYTAEAQAEIAKNLQEILGFS